jgi:hypothetical protein
MRLLFGTGQPYPCERIDKYGWTWDFPSFEAQLATVASHECFHRAAHLWPAQFPGQDWRSEEQANTWALQQVQRLGYDVHASAPTQGVAHG